jgi:heptosyltransferase-2
LRNKKIERILVIRNDRIGDLILSLPAISALRKCFPKAFISVLVKDYCKEILWNNPDINEIIVDKDQSRLKLAKEIAGRRFDAVVVLYPRFINGFLSWISKIPIRVGTGYKLTGIFFNRKVYIHRTKIVHHESDYCLKIIKRLKDFPENGFKIKISIKDKDIKYIKKLFEKYNISNKEIIVVVHPGCGGSAINWKEESYARLIDALIEKFKIVVILTGNKGERILGEKIVSLCKNKPLNLSGMVSLGELKALLSICKLFIGPSTGPMHLASALGKMVIAIFPPVISQSHLKWAPLGKKIILTPKGIICKYKKCRLKRCKEFNCMEKINLNEMLEAVEKGISNG